MFSEAPFSTLPFAAFYEWFVNLLGTGRLTATENFDFRIYAATAEYISRSTDTPANQPFFGTLSKAPRLERSIINGFGFGGVTSTWGEAELINLDGGYDYLVPNYAVDGRAATFKIGDPATAYLTFLTMAVLTATGMQIAEDVVRLQLRDKSYRLDVPAQTTTYAGTGDLEGTTDLAGKRKPLAFGALRNISPAQVIPSELVFQVNDGPVQAIAAVYDSGVALSGPSADFATSALLRAAAITDGWFATCIAEGMFRLGASAFGQITADVSGDKTGSTYVNTTGTIVRRLLTRATDVVDPTELDIVSFANLETLQPAVIGYYIDPLSTATVADVIADLMAGIGGWGGFIRLGLFQVGRFTAPSGVSVASYDDIDVTDITIDRVESIDPPPWRQRVAFARNWTIIDNPAASVGTTQQAFLAKPFRVSSTLDSAGNAILASHLLATDPDVVNAYFDVEADALAEANRRLTLYNSQYVLFRFTIKDHPFLHDIGQCVTLTYPRWNLTGGRQLRVAGIIDDTDNNTVELRAFG